MSLPVSRSTQTSVIALYFIYTQFTSTRRWQTDANATHTHTSARTQIYSHTICFSLTVLCVCLTYSRAQAQGNEWQQQHSPARFYINASASCTRALSALASFFWWPNHTHTHYATEENFSMIFRCLFVFIHMNCFRNIHTEYTLNRNRMEKPPFFTTRNQATTKEKCKRCDNVHQKTNSAIPFIILSEHSIQNCCQQPALR